MNLLPAAANACWTASCLPALARFRAALRRPELAQQQRLRSCVRQNADTAFGRDHCFAEISSYAEFARRVPLSQYDDLQPWIERMRAGEQQVLTREPVSHLIPTSGSSGARKLIPFTRGLQREFNEAIGPWIVDLFRSCPAAGAGSSYWSITPAWRGEEMPDSTVPIGFEDDSAYLGGVKRRLVNAVLAVPPAVRLVTDMEAFRYVTLLWLLARRDLRLISVWHPSYLTLLLESMRAHWDDLRRDLHDGRVKCEQEIPTSQRQALRPAAQPRRAAELERVDPARPATVWPELSVISCWGDGAAEGAVAGLQALFPGVWIQRKGLLATEGCVSIPFRRSHPLALNSHFFEFIDRSDRIHLAHELQAGEVYEVVITTGGGLWRYRLRDEVQVTGFSDATPCVRFLGRRGNVSDRFGEKLSESFVARVIDEVIGDLRLASRFLLLAPDDREEGVGYTLYVEGDLPEGVSERLDERLRGNPHYAWCRDLGQLKALRVFQIGAGAYAAFVAREVARGRQLGAIKPALLSTCSGWTQRFQGEYVHECRSPRR